MKYGPPVSGRLQRCRRHHLSKRFIGGGRGFGGHGGGGRGGGRRGGGGFGIGSYADPDAGASGLKKRGNNVRQPGHVHFKPNRPSASPPSGSDGSGAPTCPLTMHSGVQGLELGPWALNFSFFDLEVFVMRFLV